MRVELNLNYLDIKKILDSNKYVTETVTLWYKEKIGGYDSEYEPLLHPIGTVVAYESGKRPKTLDGIKPLLEDNEEHKIESVVERLFKEKVMSLF